MIDFDVAVDVISVNFISVYAQYDDWVMSVHHSEGGGARGIHHSRKKVKSENVIKMHQTIRILRTIIL